MPITEKKVKTPNKGFPAASRLNFRLAPEVKERVIKAAALSGQDLTEFAVAALREKADQTIEKYESVFLSNQDFEFFLQALDAQSEPSPKAREAAERYRRGKKEGAKYNLAD